MMKSLIPALICLLLVISCGAPVIAADDFGPSVLVGGIHYANGVDGDYLEENLVTGYQRRDGYVLQGPKYAPNEIIVKFKKAAAAKVEAELPIAGKVKELKLTDSLDGLNWKYRVRNIKSIFKGFKEKTERLEALSGKDEAVLSKRERRLLRRLKRAPEDVKLPALERIYKLEVVLEEGQSLEEAVEAYQNDPDVEYAELNYIVSIAVEPNDPNFPVQWPLNNTGQMYPESGRYRSPPGTEDCDIDAPEAWDIYTGSSETIVAVVDTGVDYTHRDLVGNIWVNEAESNGTGGIDDDENGYIDDIYGYDFYHNDSNPKDDHGHGTHCAGTIGAEGNNELDIAGVCWNTKIMSLKFLGASGTGNLSNAMEAFYYAIESGADVLSNSWGGGGYVESMQETINYAHSMGVVLVAAAGNDNSNSVHYPAGYEHVIAVAATDSNDVKAPFSNYGDWVDLAAPGVDILSLRAEGTSGGTTYGDYLTVASGTSMACPHVAGACALLLSTNPALSNDNVNDILRQTGDPILPGICASNGRLNIFNAILASTTSQGVVSLDRDYYSCSSVINIWLADRDLGDNNTHDVNMVTDGGDLETVLLTKTIPTVGVFTGTISIASGEPNSQDGTVQVSHGQLITVTYEDANDGTGSPATVIDTATADCQLPVISNVQIDIPGPEPTVSFDTNEPTVAKVFYGLSCMDPDALMRIDSTLLTSHSTKLVGVSPETKYYFTIHAIDVAGNETIDANDGQCYSFTTDGPSDINVPGQYPTIQEAIDKSWDGGTVWIADGVYTGAGNRDINFKGKAITVKSENGAENCIIDCNGTADDPHRGFTFVSGEGPDSVIDGLTITGGYGPEEVVIFFRSSAGNAIFCDALSSPTIKNCIIEDNTGGRGAIFCLLASSPTISWCTIRGNSTEKVGAGIYCGLISSPEISHCSITGNYAWYGGGIFCWLGSSPIVSHCTITGNSALNYGGAFFCNDSSPEIAYCTITGNSTADFGSGIYCLNNSSPRISNCILWGDIAAGDKPEISLKDGIFSNPHLTVSYSDVQGGQTQAHVDPACVLAWGPGNIETDPCFVEPGEWTDPYNTPADANDDVWIDGNYHLQSEAGRWDPNTSSWVADAHTSYCIDSGNPGCVLGDEPNEPNNIRVNMGVYGGTAEASMPPYGWTLLSDITNDGTVDFVDFAHLTDMFTDQGDELPGDFDRDGDVNLADLDWLTYDWLLQTIWYEP